jgi:beta-mannosidase
MSQIYRPLFNELKDLGTEVQVSQFAQAEGLRYANQAHRRHKWHRSACVSWTFNEPWPNAAHGCVVEYYGQPKMAYYYARDSYAEVDVSAEYGALYVRSGEQLRMKLFVTSERKEALKKSIVKAKVVDLDGRVMGQQEWAVDVVAEDNTRVGDVTFVPSKELEGKVILIVTELYNREGERLSGHTYTFGVIGADKEQSIPKGYMNNLLTATQTNLAISVKLEKIQEWYGKKTKTYRVIVRNTGKAPGLFVKLDTDCEDSKTVYIEDNYFTLLAGEKRDVYMFIPDKDKSEEIGVMQVYAKAWNSKSVTAPVYDIKQ